jgi:hypothetical protein
VYLGSDIDFFAIKREHDGLLQTCHVLAHNKPVLMVLPVKRETDMARGSSPAFYLRLVFDNQFQQLTLPLFAKTIGPLSALRIRRFDQVGKFS